MTQKISFSGNILMLGYGTVGRATLPLLIKHFNIPLSQLSIVEAHDHREELSSYIAQGMHYEQKAIRPENLSSVLATYLKHPNDLLLNLSTEVSSLELIRWCQKHQVLYLDTCVEPWANYYDNSDIPAHERTNYFLRQQVKEEARHWPKGSASALVTHGANPGLISSFVKAALLQLGEEKGLITSKPTSREAWADLMHQTGVKVIHVAEHDTQICNIPKQPNEFVNTWSVVGFTGEGTQPSELGWGTHEKKLPDNAHTHPTGPGCAIYLDQAGCDTYVASWTPTMGRMVALCITHGESISLADYFTVYQGEKALFRPTVHYAYRPCNDALLSLHEFRSRNYHLQEKQRIPGPEIIEGRDDLGALLMGDFGALWYGSQLDIHEARTLLGPEFNATSVQIACAVVAGAAWIVAHPRSGLLEPEDLDHEMVLNFCKPYLGNVVAVKTDWTPLQGRFMAFPQPYLDWSDPWQFSNFHLRH